MRYWLILMAIFLALSGCNDGPKIRFKKIRKKKKVIKVQTQYFTFPSLDKLTAYGKLYFIDSISAPIIIMFHQDGYNKTEYDSIAKLIVPQGFMCASIDLRCGGDLNDTINQTHEEALKENLPVGFLDAEQDMLGALNHLANRFNRKKFIIWGSSYSASLSLKMANEFNLVSSVLAFSPGEYFGNDLDVATTINGLNKPVFITCAKSENGAELSGIVKACANNKNLTFFVPRTEGRHGSSALWPDNPNSFEYWTAVNKFLASVKNMNN
jgi:dienelactone hydrolase